MHGDLQHSQAILGVRADYDGLTIDPCIPSDFGDFRIVRRFRGAVYNIRVHQTNGVQKGVARLLVDGRELSGS